MADVRTPLDIALDLLARGIAPVPVPRTKDAKGPNIRDWQHLVVTPENAAQYFDNGQAVNVGAIMGPRSGGLTDVDLDCREAVALAPSFLPQTGSMYGRASKRKSHYLYRCPDPPDKATKKIVDETGSVILELRLGGGGKGAQSVWPGSLHKTGEYYEWDIDGEPKRVAFADLDLAAKKIAVGTLLIRHWPSLGGRHDAALTVGGFLARIGWSPDAIADFVQAVATEHGEADDPAAHGRTARDSAERFGAGGTVYGLPQMIETFGDAVARQIAKIVGYRGREVPEPTSPDDRPLIKVARGSLSTNADEAEQALVAAGVPFFERSNALVRPIG
jgi:bifunctional DNA primase/polymerase-like protein